eukprot:758563-Hanusia_phi.AAC.6
METRHLFLLNHSYTSSPQRKLSSKLPLEASPGRSLHTRDCGRPRAPAPGPERTSVAAWQAESLKFKVQKGRSTVTEQTMLASCADPAGTRPHYCDSVSPTRITCP